MLLLPLTLALTAVTAEPPPAGPPVDLARIALLNAPPVRPTAAAPAAPESAEYLIDAAAKATLVFLLPDGPRTIRSVEVIPTPGSAQAWERATLRLTWESDDPEPDRAGVDLPLGLAFGHARGFPAVESLAVGTSGDAWVNRFPMPYRAMALLRIDTGAPLAGKIRVLTTRGVDPDAGYFRGAIAAGPDRLDVAGRGHLAGILLTTEGKGPEPAGRLVVDEKPVGPLSAVLGEMKPDAGSGALRGRLVPAVVADSDSSPARSVAYCWRVGDPIAFRTSFSVETGPGPGADDARPGATRTAAVFWYSEGPGLARVGR